MKKKFFIIYSIIFIKLCGLNTNVYAATSFDCNSLGNLKRDLENFFNLFKVIVPLLVIGLSTYDFIKAITNKDDKDIKKAFSKLMKRLIAAVALFFLPILIELLLGLIIDNASVCIGTN